MTTTSPSNLDLTKPVQTRDGRKARIICTDRKGAYPVLYLVENSMNAETAICCYEDGMCNPNQVSHNDLVNVPITVRVCFYESKGSIQSLTIYEGSYWTEEKLKQHYTKSIICFKDIVLDT